MTTPGLKQVKFEEQLYAAFPRHPAPAVVLSTRTEFEREAMAYLDGRRWPEAVGYQLRWGGLDVSPPIWIAVLPANIMAYFLPSHLMLASLGLKFGEVSDDCSRLMDALVLPPADPAELAIIDNELNLDWGVAFHGQDRVALYAALTPAQRACVATFLDLYLLEHSKDFSERGLALYTANRDYWAQSSYPLHY